MAGSPSATVSLLNCVVDAQPEENIQVDQPGTQKGSREAIAHQSGKPSTTFVAHCRCVQEIGQCVGTRRLGTMGSRDVPENALLMTNDTHLPPKKVEIRSPLLGRPFLSSTRPRTFSRSFLFLADRIERKQVTHGVVTQTQSVGAIMYWTKNVNHQIGCPNISLESSRAYSREIHARSPCAKVYPQRGVCWHTSLLQRLLQFCPLESFFASAEITTPDA